jgi:hypothetical protein
MDGFDLELVLNWLLRKQNFANLNTWPYRVLSLFTLADKMKKNIEIPHRKFPWAESHFYSHLIF